MEPNIFVTGLDEMKEVVEEIDKTLRELIRLEEKARSIAWALNPTVEIKKSPDAAGE